MVVLHTDRAVDRLGEPGYVSERGTVTSVESTYSRRWHWPCGCSGEIIAGALIQLVNCQAHAR